jgi:hypothetical protein
VCFQVGSAQELKYLSANLYVEMEFCWEMRLVMMDSMITEAATLLVKVHYQAIDVGEVHPLNDLYV